MDPGLYDHSGSKRARLCTVYRGISRIDPGKVQVCADSLLSGTVQQSIRLCVYGPADTISLSLVHIFLDPGTSSQVAAIFKTSRGTIITGGNYRIILDDYRPVLSLNAGTSICKIFCTVQIRINF